MSTRRGKAPSYWHHKPSGRAFVQLKRRRIYLGNHGSETSIEAYNRFLAEHCPAAEGSQPPAVLAPIKREPTIVELIDRYWQHAQHFYRRHDPYAAPPAKSAKPADSAAGPSQRRISMLGLPRPAKANPCWTLHDLRRSFVMHVSELGFAQPHALGAIVNHVRGSQGWRGRCP